ncbi:signal peptidase II [Pseudoduganella sp. GCM10020061]|uniref:signal peptidase II n=1 Tax=Pseudoduganella sp. GCM10020061 TaxID=3317345 RepID=UPI00362EBB07
MATKKAVAGKPAFSASKSAPRGSLVPWLGIAAIIVLFDQLTKIVIEKIFHYGEVLPVTSFFNLVLAYNKGAAFSFLAGAGGWQRYFFTAVGIIAVVFIVQQLRKHADQRLFCLSFSFIMGGAIGNVIDRVVYGHVVDFLDFHWTGIGHFPAFNLADIAITLGAAMFIIDELRRVNRK